MIWLASLALLSIAPDIRIVTPDGSGPVSLVVVEYRGGREVGCVRDPCGADTDVVVERRGAAVLRHYAGPRLPRRIVLRAVLPPVWTLNVGTVRRLAVLERTDRGDWFTQWEAPIERGQACLPPEVVAHYRMVGPARRPAPDRAICLRR